MSEYAASWLNFEETLGGVRPVLRGTTQDMRAQYDGLLSFLSSQHPPTSDEVKVNQEEVSGVEYRTYIPHACETKHLPIGVFYHSGGLVVGSLDAEDAFCRQVALRANVIIVNVGYRLSPEHKAPAHLEDAVTLYEWVYNNAQRIGGDHSRIFAMGTSAGGALALAVTRKVALGQASIPADSCKGMVVLCPVTLHPLNVPAKYQAVYQSYEEKKENVPVVDQTSLSQMFDNTGIEPDDEQYFPVLDDGCLKLFPPTYLVTCGQDPLRDDGKVLQAALSSAGVPIQANHYDNMPHCFWMVPSLPETKTFLNFLMKGVEWIVKARS
ncbi:hypothetical protein NM208_g3559 [Fusarium decemcellulare]|uniref:Uncharacterized protein n=1 Tax=Fusarium decemcellulare TaxID=57161 RepID=A0ACC1SNM5_9HYPO|nr:hypothetical protein NM208_g3559 [Fusarium decemcellulare]